MRCSHAQKLISFFINGELAQAPRRELEQHLSECAACREAARQYAELSRLSHSLSTPAEPEGFYENFFADMMARTAPATAQKNKPATKKFAWLALRPKFAFAGIGALAAVIAAGVLLIKENGPDRTTLEDYLIRRDFTALARALADDQQRSLLIGDSVSVGLLIESLKALDKMNAGYGQVAQNMAPLMAMLQQEISKRPGQSTTNLNARATPRVLRAALFPGAFDFKKTIRALRLINRPGIKITLIDLASYWPDSHRQAQL